MSTRVTFVDNCVHQLSDPSSLYGVLHSQYDRFNEIVGECMGEIILKRSFGDPPNGLASGVVIFDTLITVLTE